MLFYFGLYYIYVYDLGLGVRVIVQYLIFLNFLTLSLKLMQWYVTSVSRGSLHEKFGNKCVKILKFWRTELSDAQSKNRGKKMRLLGMDTCPSLNDIMEIRCNKCTRSEQGYDFYTSRVVCLVDY
jgi:hypothetical protein